MQETTDDFVLRQKATDDFVLPLEDWGLLYSSITPILRLRGGGIRFSNSEYQNLTMFTSFTNGFALWFAQFIPIASGLTDDFVLRLGLSEKSRYNRGG